MRSLFIVLLLTPGAFLSGRPRLVHGEVPVQDGGHGTLAVGSEPQNLTTARIITGMVLDPSGAAIAGAQLKLTRTDGKTLATTMTSNLGRFRFENVKMGNYEIDVEAKSFRKARIRVVLGTKSPKPVRVTMAIASEPQVV